jgi:hypothetical protein
MLQMFGVLCWLTLLVEIGVSTASLSSVVITGLVTKVSILLFRFTSWRIYSDDSLSSDVTSKHKNTPGAPVRDENPMRHPAGGESSWKRLQNSYYDAPDG